VAKLVMTGNNYRMPYHLQIPYTWQQEVQRDHASEAHYIGGITLLWYNDNNNYDTLNDLSLMAFLQLVSLKCCAQMVNVQMAYPSFLEQQSGRAASGWFTRAAREAGSAA